MNVQKFKESLLKYPLLSLQKYYEKFAEHVEGNRGGLFQVFNWQIFFDYYEKDFKYFKPLKTKGFLKELEDLSFRKKLWENVLVIIKESWADCDLDEDFENIKLEDVIYYTMQAVVYEEFKYLNDFQDLKEYLEDNVEGFEDELR